ncbi:MAG TPA: aminoglycoside phosphotransferase [Methylothermaceae bacterium]|nr:aminoglycoside phosphotransferase [Methylothermaceae bacterium]
MSLPPLIRALLKPDPYDHSTESIHYRETHISWIILTGPFAYKIKKPVDFGFLDFSTLEKRRFYCHEELRLNRRLAPQLYLEVVKITGRPEAPRMGGPGPILEYAVKMRQFDEANLLAELAEHGRLSEAHILPLAHRIARFHRQAERAGADDPYGEPEVIQAAALENFRQIDTRRLGESVQAIVAELEAWTRESFVRLKPFMTQRKHGGWIRECHGDLHLGNIVLWQGQPLPFDCIEFNPALRWIDVISEIAFTVMDLAARGYCPLGFRFLNEYLSDTGDYPGVKLLRYYLVYRAMVRAKIAWLSAAQQEQPGEQISTCQRYLDLAREFSRPQRPVLYITYGFSGSGKSYACRRLAAHLPALHLRSDVERKRLAGLAAGAVTQSGLGKGIYSADFTERTYGKLLEDARTILDAGFGVIVDATFLRRKYRDRFRQLADDLRVPFRILDFRAEETVLRQRIAARQQQRRDPSEADLTVLEYQLRHHDPLDESERAVTVTFDTSHGFELQSALSRLQDLKSWGSS